MLSCSLLMAASCWVVGQPAPEVLPCESPPAGMACIPGGWFVRGSDNDEHVCQQRFGRKLKQRPNARPAAKVWVQTYYMDLHEVTYEAYAQCIAQKKCQPRPEDGRWGPLYTDFSRPKQPITGVSLYQAQEYCQAHGKALPTEAQWERAARGPDSEPFPWGHEPPTCERAVIKTPELGRSCGVKKKGSAKTGRVLEVGSKPAGRYGIYDLIGNVEEWVADWYSHDYQACGSACLGVEPKGPCNGDEPCRGHKTKVVRGGSWYWDASHGTAIHRRPHIPQNTAPKRFHHFGFRCAKNILAAAEGE